jgi:hypothetical protein
MKKRSVLRRTWVSKQKNQKTDLVVREAQPDQNQSVHLLFAWLAQELTKKGIYQEWSVYEEYENMSYAMKGIYTYLYDQKRSSLSTEDAKIFASYLMGRVQSLKQVIEKTKK